MNPLSLKTAAFVRVIVETKYLYKVLDPACFIKIPKSVSKNKKEESLYNPLVVKEKIISSLYGAI